MSGYADGEALVLSTLRQHSNYDSDNTSRADWKPIDSGRADRYAVLKPGAFSIDPISLGGIGSSAQAVHETTWRTIIELWRRYLDDGTSHINLQGDVATVIAHMQKYRRLQDTGNTVRISRVTGGGDMQQVPALAPKWLYWEVYVDWVEETTTTYAE